MGWASHEVHPISITWSATQLSGGYCAAAPLCCSAGSAFTTFPDTGSTRTRRSVACGSALASQVPARHVSEARTVSVAPTSIAPGSHANTDTLSIWEDNCATRTPSLRIDAMRSLSCSSSSPPRTLSRDAGSPATTASSRVRIARLMVSDRAETSHALPTVCSCDCEGSLRTGASP